jgi:hypothetical protein
MVDVNTVMDIASSPVNVGPSIGTARRVEN